jgi:branched-chain amino acid transport system substrate-binding protein
MLKDRRRQPARQVHDLAAGNPVQDMYLREVKGNNNEFRSIAVKALADPATGCSM